jgi:ApaG protein
MMYHARTRDIDVKVQPSFLENQSEPADNVYVWAYRVQIANRGRETVCLRSRHWKITDAMGRVQVVDGPGVVGEQPVLKPGESFEYTSGAPLSTPSGIMGGTYRMESEDGQAFDVEIPTFSLDSPFQSRALN